MIYKYLAGAAIIAAACFGSWLYGRSQINEQWQADKAVWQASYAAQVKETARIETAWKTSEEQIDAWKSQAKAAGAAAADVARRLRNYQANSSRCAVSETPADSGVSEPASGESGDIGSLEESHFAACARDASRLSQLQNWYRGLAQEHPSEGPYAPPPDHGGT